MTDQINDNYISIDTNKNLRTVLSIVNNLFIFSKKYKCGTDMLKFANLFESKFRRFNNEEQILNVYGDFKFNSKLYKFNREDIRSFIDYITDLSKCRVNKNEYFEDKTMTENLLYKIIIPNSTELPIWVCRTMVLQATIMEFMYRVCLFLKFGSHSDSIDNKKQMIIELLDLIEFELDSDYYIDYDLIQTFDF